MRGVVLIICFCASVLAAPQGYLYNQQQNSLSAGISDFSSSSQVADTATTTQDNHGFLQQGVNTGSLSQTLLSGQPAAVQNTQQFSAVPNFSALQQQQYAPLLSSYDGQLQQQQQQQQQQHQGPLSGNFGLQQQPFNGFAQQHYQQPYQIPGTITKDIYVHVAPEDTQEQQYQQQRHVAPLPPRKHYRIVFIKAPTQHSNNAAALRLQQAPTEEKTIIYVLTKKADPLDLQNAIQEIQPKQPSKPEVYFIKYKTQAEAQHAQRTIQAQYDKLGGTSQISDEGIAPVTSVIGSLDNTQPQTALDFSNVSGHSSSSSISSSTSSSSSSSFASSGANNNASNYLPPLAKL